MNMPKEYQRDQQSGDWSTLINFITDMIVIKYKNRGTICCNMDHMGYPGLEFVESTISFLSQWPVD